MGYSICKIAESNEFTLQAAKILKTTFMNMGNELWSNIDDAIKEVEECIQSPNICFGICDNSILIGWIGLRPMYEKTWELHPMVISTDYQGKGLGRKLISEVEKNAKEKGIIGIVLGTDDESNKTTLSKKDIDGSNVLNEIQNIKNLNRHPYEFYQKCGYAIIGVIPNANGKRKPDIWMWKEIK